MSNNPNPQFSNKMLETANEAMDTLIEGASEMYRAFLYLLRIHDDKGFPVDGQRLSELSQMMLSMRKMLFDQKAELDLTIAGIEDAREVEDWLSKIDNKSEPGRAEAK